MILLRLGDPAVLHHFEEHVRAKNNLNLIKSVRWHSHANHVAEAVCKRTSLHFKVQTVGHLDQSLDRDGLKTELHDHHIVHESVEGHGRATFNIARLLFNVDPDLFLHHVVHELEDLVRDHGDLEIPHQLLVLLCTQLKRLFDC